MIEMRNPWKRRAAIVADVLLAAVAKMFVRGGGGGVPERPRVLVVRPDHIGDAVMATAVFEPLRRALDPERLDVFAGPWAAGVLVAHPRIDEAIVYALPWWIAARGGPWRDRLRAWLGLPGLVRRIRRARYDVAIDLRGDLRQIFFLLALGGAPERVSTDRTGGRRLLTRTWPYDPDLHLVEQNMAIVGLLGAQSQPRLDLPEPQLSPTHVRRIDCELGGRPFVALALKGNHPNKGWPAELAARFVELAARELGIGAVFVGSGADRPLGDAIQAESSAPVVNVAGETSLADAVAIFAASAVTVAVDSGPMHLAAAAGAPVVSLFGPTNPHEVHAWTDRNVVVAEGAPCGCIHPTCDFGTDGPGRCMQRITPERVLAAVRALIAPADRAAAES